MRKRKILRKIYSSMKGQYGWRTRTNDELQVVNRKPNIVTTIQVRRLEWAGRLVRMSDERTVKKVFRVNQVEEEKQEDQNLGG